MAKARLLPHERVVVDETTFAEIKIREVPRPARGSVHMSKYPLAPVAKGICVLRYDNEAGKGDRRHGSDGRERPHPFRSAETLIVREVARRVDRDVKAVHGDVRALVDAGLVEDTGSGVRFGYDAVRVEFTLQAA